jgi:hypothetical protein
MSDIEERKVISLNGGNDMTPGRVNANAVKSLEDALEQAKSGQLVGVSITKRFSDGMGAWENGGTVGGFSMLGAAVCAMEELTRIALGKEEDD